MDPVTIGVLVSSLGPIVIPALSNGIIWIFNRVLGMLSPSHQALVSPFLPIFAGAVGTALSTATGGGALAGAVNGLAATGAHQAVTQILKAAKKNGTATTPTPPPA